jgi:Methyltransferase domain
MNDQYGVSYMAFCQAICRLGLEAKCLAIDTWKGDEQTGFYGEDVFETLSRGHDGMYSHFSQLIRTTFDEASSYFEDGSIDLLHSDGLQTSDAVKHDFENWYSKLSQNVVVLAAGSAYSLASRAYPWAKRYRTRMPPTSFRAPSPRQCVND